MTEFSRRQLLGWTGGAGATGLVAGMAGGLAAERGDPSGASDDTEAARLGPYDAVVREHDVPHGLDRPVPAFGHVLSFRLAPHVRSDPGRAKDVAISSLKALAAQIKGDVVAQESAPVAPASLGTRPSGLQLTPGIGASLLEACGLSGHRPAGLADVPAFSTDRLDPELCGGDLVVQVGAEDPMRLAGAVQRVRTLMQHDWVVSWSRSGFRATPAAAADPKATVRNLMGHRDGTANRPVGSPLWKATTLSPLDDWMQNGSYLVVRQIVIDLDRWYTNPEALRDKVIGRRTSDGAPLGRRHEHEAVNLAARDADGALDIPAHAHIRLAGTQATLGAMIYRRSWNFDDGDASGRRRAGLLFLAWQADIEQGFVAIQKALVKGHDSLSGFTTHIGSAAFAVPAMGVDDYVGQRLFEQS